MAFEFWRGQRVLVTGGAGFIGSHVAEVLQEAGAAVTIASRFRKQGFRFVEHLAGRVEFVEGDLAAASHAAVCTRGKDAVLHFASKIAGLGYNSGHPAEMLSDNAILDLQVLNAAAHNSVPLFLYVSGALVYDAGVPIPTREEESVSGIPTEDCKGTVWAKRIGEKAVEYFIEERNMKIAVARLSNVYGPRDDFGLETSHLIGNVIRAVANGAPPEIWGDGSPTRSYLYVSDAVRALLLLAELGANKGPVNICSQHEYTVRQIVDRILEASGARVEPMYRPGPWGASRRRLDTGKLHALTGFAETVDLREGIRQTVEWFRANRPRLEWKSSRTTWHNALAMAPIEELPDWERLLAAERHLQYLVPGTVLGGGTAAALHARHRLSVAGDHVLSDLRERFDEVLATLEAVAGWSTERVQRPVLILGQLDGILTGVRQLRRTRPLEIEEVVGLRVPTLAEMTRIKAWLLATRHSMRDYLDTVVLCERLGETGVAQAMRSFDAIYRQPTPASPLAEVVERLAAAAPSDATEVDLQRYRALQAPWTDWAHVTARGRHWAQVIARVVLEANA